MILTFFSVFKKDILGILAFIVGRNNYHAIVITKKSNIVMILEALNLKPLTSIPTHVDIKLSFLSLTPIIMQRLYHVCGTRIHKISVANVRSSL